MDYVEQERMKRAAGVDATCEASWRDGQDFFIPNACNPLERLDSKK